MSFPLILNENNAISNNRYRYTFPQNFDFSDKTIAIDNINMYYSWFNVTPGFNNNQFNVSSIDKENKAERENKITDIL